MNSGDPQYRDPISKLNAICQQHDIVYSKAGNDLAKKHKADDVMVKSIGDIPFSQRPWFSTPVKYTMQSKTLLGLGLKPKHLKSRRVKKLQEKLANELHKTIKRKFTRRGVIANHVDEIWASDLVEMQQFSKWNKGYKYLLMVIDVFSKHGWIVPLKNKQGETVRKHVQCIFKDGRKPRFLWTDKGAEFYKKRVKELLAKTKIALYSTENEENSSEVERWNRTIKNKMWKQFTVQGNANYLGFLPRILKQYNNTKHSSIKMTPTEACNKKNEGVVYFNLYGDMEQSSYKPKFKIGDKVRISKYKEKHLIKVIHQIGRKKYSQLIKSNTLIQSLTN